MGKEAADLRWGVEKRLEFIEFRLLWEGGINRADIMKRFGVSVPQASKDLSLYEEKAPGNLLYDKSEKRYFAAPKFRPVFLKPEADRYLAQLRSIADRIVQPEESWLSHLPEFDAMPVPHRRVDANVLRSIVAAIRRKRSLEIHYQSMNPARSNPEWRWITPHALANDGLRWHVRAHCHIDRKFKDFLLSRCLGAGIDGAPGADAADDTLWNDFFDVILKPNPALSKTQQEVIAQDYNMIDCRVCVPVRKAHLYYFQKRLRLDVADAFDDPQEVPILVANDDAFTEALAEAKA
ncbi:WYL domain-containing protein [Bradyrhizobium sp. AUGA SZCCT0160]|uniref:WYL domain-containing protein n=1 Tax=Bradyrhizobium sp. AUGA SZCCT0160 TaxID=2807662 RepID=UPI001BADD0B9|nr:WYL domain-containing protein [Bradyrhizobium sp. AUGA SZCCT0160]MBR1191481.1 WYL domain-containing protein [Bradyrhizobium sp. AUGA SZCCT0160]